MADDPRVPPYVIDAVMREPTAQRLVHLTGFTQQDMRTDLSSLMYVAITAVATDRPHRPFGLV